LIAIAVAIITGMKMKISASEPTMSSRRLAASEVEASAGTPIESSGRPPIWSSERTPSRNSKSRGTTSTATAASREARIASSSSSWLTRDVLQFDDLREVGEAAEPGQVRGAGVVDLVVDDPDRDQAELGVVADLLDHLSGDLAGAEDQRALAQVGDAVEAGTGERPGQAAEDEEREDRGEGDADRWIEPDQVCSPVGRPGHQHRGDEVTGELGDGRGPAGQLFAAVQADAEGGERPKQRHEGDKEETAIEIRSVDDEGKSGGQERGEKIPGEEHPSEDDPAMSRP
jgi:hypothetical protein